jgi:hypothetical protein
VLALSLEGIKHLVESPLLVLHTPSFRASRGRGAIIVEVGMVSQRWSW